VKVKRTERGNGEGEDGNEAGDEEKQEGMVKDGPK
jgi:hypothetical protein